ncbi:myo-inositol-1-phosphate synthase [Streptomyces sp. A244]|uniref:inositol-3-phosphate synthase n=1 Tax=Streptomyces sp. A244 TaxID=2137016 RepID=UPI000D19D2E8|nr:inositol-3-phosphate synthase [Streptomyces sp. A244]PTH90245.1 myo-inositol-1-phosphate synthase [Streptomyces sp. A244]
MTRRTGVWLVGARGSVATTTVVGAAALRGGLLPPTGCVTALPSFAGLPLPRFDELVFGGHDMAETDLPKRAEQLAHAGVIPGGLPELLREDLLAADAEIRPGADAAECRVPGDAVEALVADLVDFRERNGLDRVVVVNVATTEARPRAHPARASWRELRQELGRATPPGEEPLPSSSLYACAALLAGCPYVDFTPSAGIRFPALEELAVEQRLPYAGSDGKTGETLVKSALAPMFAHRALRVSSWTGTNLLGGGDGAALANPERAASKSDSKARVLQAALGHPVDGGVHIHHVPQLGEWKTAWDHITFDGFLGTRMTMQFTWQGCDSALAAPLVLDLARLMALAHAEGVHGPVAELAFFFKDPLGTEVHALEPQFTALVDWAHGLGAAR